MQSRCSGKALWDGFPSMPQAMFKSLSHTQNQMSQKQFSDIVRSWALPIVKQYFLKP